MSVSDKQRLYIAEVNRWYGLRDHPVQQALVEDLVRFKVVPAGRRSGKTEKAKRYIVKTAMQTLGDYFVAAPTRDQVKRIYWKDLKLLSFSSLHVKPPMESNLSISLPNGSTISLIGLDKPQRIEGIFWSGGVIDEIADTKENSWEENIKPALDTFNPENPEYRAWCWLIGVPNGLNHFYERAEYAKISGDPEWKLYTWKSSEILPSDITDAAKRSMSPRQYRQEYEASFENASGRVYEDYGAENICHDEIFQHEQLMWFHDFNFTPMSSAIGVVRNNKFYILDEIILDSAISRQSAMEFTERYKDHQNKSMVLYGDPAGRAGEKHGHASDYTEMNEILVRAGWQVERKIKNCAPAIKDRQSAVRAKICNAMGERNLFVNPNKCPVTHKGLSTVQIKEGSTFIEIESRFQHITTAVGYCVEYEWPIRVVDDSKFVQNVPSHNYFNKSR
jgi:hypothetical protein